MYLDEKKRWFVSGLDDGELAYEVRYRSIS
jgi:hypothetical protein